MAVALHVYIRDKGAKETDPVSVEHVFYGRTAAEVDAKRTAHLAGCSNFAQAEADKRTEDVYEDITDSEMPTWEDVMSDDEEDDEETIDVEGAEADDEEYGSSSH